MKNLSDLIPGAKSVRDYNYTCSLKFENPALAELAAQYGIAASDLNYQDVGYKYLKAMPEYQEDLLEMLWCWYCCCCTPENKQQFRPFLEEVTNRHDEISQGYVFAEAEITFAGYHYERVKVSAEDWETLEEEWLEDGEEEENPEKEEYWIQKKVAGESLGRWVYRLENGENTTVWTPAGGSTITEHPAFAETLERQETDTFLLGTNSVRIPSGLVDVKAFRCLRLAGERTYRLSFPTPEDRTVACGALAIEMSWKPVDTVCDTLFPAMNSWVNLMQSSRRALTMDALIGCGLYDNYDQDAFSVIGSGKRDVAFVAEALERLFFSIDWIDGNSTAIAEFIAGNARRKKNGSLFRRSSAHYSSCPADRAVDKGGLFFRTMPGLPEPAHVRLVITGYNVSDSSIRIDIAAQPMFIG